MTTRCCMRDSIISGNNINRFRAKGFIVYSFYTTLESLVNRNCLTGTFNLLAEFWSTFWSTLF